jgi:hypothetical protein
MLKQAGEAGLLASIKLLVFQKKRAYIIRL